MLNKKELGIPWKPEQIAELKNVAVLANQRQHRNTCIEVETYPNHTIKLAFNRETSDYANSIADFITKFDPHTILKILDALETSEGVQKDMMESMGHMQDEVAEWKRVAENNAQGMVGLQGIIDKQNDVLDRVRDLKPDGSYKITVYDLNTALNCTVCGKDREKHG